MKKYAQTQIAALIGKFAWEARRAAQQADAEAVHDLRVAIRRLSRGLRVFAQFFPGSSWKQIRRELSEFMDYAAEVRDRDIAVELLEEAGVAQRALVLARLRKERAASAQALTESLAKWRERKAARQWKEALEL
jgi:CHAD domain-containing protein